MNYMVATRREPALPRKDRPVPIRLRTADPAEVDPALQRFRAGSASVDDLRLLTKHLLALLVGRAPGGAVEVRVPPYAVAQCLSGTRHTRGTPPAVVEMDPATWIALAVGDLAWAEAERDGRLVASGERSDLSGLLPLAASAQA
jgi:Bacterial SCP ortholog